MASKMSVYDGNSEWRYKRYRLHDQPINPDMIHKPAESPKFLQTDLLFQCDARLRVFLRLRNMFQRVVNERAMFPVPMIS